MREKIKAEKRETTREAAGPHVNEQVRTWLYTDYQLDALIIIYS